MASKLEKEMIDVMDRASARHMARSFKLLQMMESFIKRELSARKEIIKADPDKYADDFIVTTETRTVSPTKKMLIDELGLEAYDQLCYSQTYRTVKLK
jgi:hypothetical protein